MKPGGQPLFRDSPTPKEPEDYTIRLRCENHEKAADLWGTDWNDPEYPCHMTRQVALGKDPDSSMRGSKEEMQAVKRQMQGLTGAAPGRGPIHLTVVRVKEKKEA